MTSKINRIRDFTWGLNVMANKKPGSPNCHKHEAKDGHFFSDARKVIFMLRLYANHGLKCLCECMCV